MKTNTSGLNETLSVGIGRPSLPPELTSALRGAIRVLLRPARAVGLGGEAEVDLSGGQGKFDAKILPENGTVAATRARVEVGRVVTLKKPGNGRTVFWLTNE